MQLIRSLQPLKNLQKPIGLTLGVFDGVHKGHLALFQELKKRCKTSIVLSFSTHPQELFNPNYTLKMITTEEHRIHLLEKAAIDYLILIPFTHEIASISARDFLLLLKNNFNIDLLVLGHNANFGKNREGTQKVVQSLCEELKISCYYLPPVLEDNQIISSTYIRSLIQKGDLKRASQFLGRPYST